MDCQPQPDRFNYRKVRLLKTECLGTGSYGAVCKAMCDLLPCAAKLLHPVLFQSTDPGAQSPMRRFEQECRFLGEMKHPHIVQYLGSTQDPDSGLPVLLMELMDESLTHFLERSQEPLPYRIEVNLCHDIALALAYLHSNDIIHRDLSSNNVLLFAGSRAKVTDFGMSKIINESSHATPFTVCPGTLAYMPPEALSDCPVYSKKIDCFSFGVLEIQIMTRRFPDPGPATHIVDDPRSPTGTTNMPILENERRKSHIVLIDPAHPLLLPALCCLSFSEQERPSAEDLCQQLATLKETSLYTQETARQLKIRELQKQNQELQAHITTLRQELETCCQQLQEKSDVIMGRKNKNIQQIQENLDKQRAIEGKERQVQQLNEQLQTNKDIKAQFQQSLLLLEKTMGGLLETVTQLKRELEQSNEEKQHADELIERQFLPPNQALHPITQAAVQHRHNTKPQQRTVPNLKWKKNLKTPEKIRRGAAVTYGEMAYFNGCNSTTVRAYDSVVEQWSLLPDCPYSNSSLVIAEGMLTAVGGDLRGKATNSVHSLTGEGRGRKWVEHFPPMPTKRRFLAAVCLGRNVIAAGGQNGDRSLRNVEILDAESLQWCAAASLPHELSSATATVCKGRLYLLGGFDHEGHTLSVFTCSIPDLLLSQSLDGHARSLALTDQSAVWHQVANTPHYWSTCVSLCGLVLAVGGMTTTNKVTSAIVAYDRTSDSWQAMRDMSTARWHALVLILPENRMMVVGGSGGDTEVEIATVS